MDKHTYLGGVLSLIDLVYGWICTNAGCYPATVWVGADCYWQWMFPTYTFGKS